jgi:imidazolonepropionase-like amidohydrolase
VAVHAHGTSGIKDAIRAGVDTIEHASLADDEAFALAKQHGTWFSMDIYNDDYTLAEGAEERRVQGIAGKGTHDRPEATPDVPGGRQGRSQNGVRNRRGGIYPNGDNAHQFATMVKWGMTPMQAIQAATVNAAEALGRTADVGAIAVGRYGDLIGSPAIRSPTSPGCSPSRSS